MERFPPYKVLQLESSFHKSPYPSHTEIQTLSESLKENTQRIKTWFSNRRTKAKRILGQLSVHTGKRVQFQIKKGKYVWKARPLTHGSHPSASYVTNPNLTSSHGKNSVNRNLHAVCVSPSTQTVSLSQNSFQNQAIRSKKTKCDVEHQRPGCTCTGGKHQRPGCAGEKHQRSASSVEGMIRTPLVAIEPTQPAAETGGHDEIVDPEYWEMMKEIGLQ